MCLTIVGVGGAGVNTISRLLDVGQAGISYLAVDTSAQTLERVPKHMRFHLSLGRAGMGTGGDPRLGEAAVLADEESLREALAGADIVLMVAGMAGGTGGGAAPEVARIARSLGAATIGFATMPFAFEAGQRSVAAGRAAKRFEVMCDTFVEVAADRALAAAGRQVTLDVALRIADDAVRQAAQGLAEVLAGQGWINVDLAAVRDLVADGGCGCVAVGVGRGLDPSRQAVAAALGSPLVAPGAWRRARSALAYVSGGPDLSVSEVAQVVDALKAAFAPDCHLVVGAGLDPALRRGVQVTVLVTLMSQASKRDRIPAALAQARRLEMARPLAGPGPARSPAEREPACQAV